MTDARPAPPPQGLHQPSRPGPWRAWLTAATLAALCLGIAAPAIGDDAALKVRATLEPAAARAGEATVLRAVLEVPKGYKLYGLQRVPGPQPTRLVLDEVPEVDVEGDWHGPPPKQVHDKGFGRKLPAYKGSPELRRVVRVATEAQPGPVRIELAVTGQICSDRTCLLQRVKVPLQLTVEAGAARAERSKAPALPGSALNSGPGEEGEGGGVAADLAALPPGLGAEQGVLGFLLTAFLAGLLALLTPCVFPMIPLTVSFFSRASGERFGRALLLAATYALSIMLTFTVAGILISVIFGATGVQRFAAHWLFNLLVAGVLVVFGLSLVGLFEIRVPSGLIQRSETLKARFAGRSGPSLASVFFMALTFTLVSFSCTVAFVGAVLVAAAQGKWFWPTLGMLSFSSAFALPFFLLALFPQAARRLQGSSGDWLPLAKVLLGFVLLAAALKFVCNVDLVLGWHVLSRPSALSFWVALFSGATLYAFKLFRFPEDPPPDDPGARTLTVPRLLVAVVVLAWTLYLGSGLVAGRPFGNWVDGWLPPNRGPSAMAGAKGEAGPGIQWLHDREEGQRQAKAKDRPLLLNFTGVTCTNCRYMEEGVLKRPEIVREMRRFVAVELYTDRGTAEDDARRTYQVETFGTAALPFYALLTPGGRVIATFPGSTNDGAEFLAFLRKAPRRPVEAPEQGGAPDAGASEPATAATAATGGPAPAAAPAPPDAAPASADGAVPGARPGLPFQLPALLPERATKFPSKPPRLVLLHHWASWCSPCRVELKGFFTKLAQEYASRGLLLVTVAFDGGDADSVEQARVFARSIDLGRWPALLAPADPPEAGLPEALTPKRFPTTLLLDAAGKVLYEHAGELTEAQLRVELDKHTLTPPAAAPAAKP